MILVTGAAGFIGSHLVEALLAKNLKVRGVDNFSTGSALNIEKVRATLGFERSLHLEFHSGDLRDLDFCKSITKDVQFIYHQAALGSVPRSLLSPIEVTENNVNGFLNLLEAARINNVKRVVFASSSSVYGTQPGFFRVERRIGEPLSPYAASKQINEIHARIYSQCYGMEVIGLRYFNVFGPRQNPVGPYSAVIARWIDRFKKGEPIEIYGDGLTTRDFTYVKNVVEANQLAMQARFNPDTQFFNIGTEEGTTLSLLFEELKVLFPNYNLKPVYKEARRGDVQVSIADTRLAHDQIGYKPAYSLSQGLRETIAA